MSSTVGWRAREPFSAASHAVGLLLSVAALVALLLLSRGRPWHITGFAIYGGSLVLLYFSSTLYHSLKVSPPQEAKLQKLDHSAIYLLIAGSYAPVCLTSLRGAWGWSLLGVLYGAALLGIAIRLLWHNAPDVLRVLLYVAMAATALVAWHPLHNHLGSGGMSWLVAGGVVYAVGTVIYALDRPHLWPGKFSAHDLWHVLVLAGSACHFVMMLYVAPTA